ncbi:hypothetical protein LTR12_012669 [Friedmanniomyces endolithicus]|nr:hypothetical protein LTR74_004606 [Friedmanniomyces endolithicus]KAK1812933.1 hypothetical protein LTR12_012669 [Friedmanniomyces endolithicus]
MRVTKRKASMRRSSKRKAPRQSEQPHASAVTTAGKGLLDNQDAEAHSEPVDEATGLRDAQDVNNRHLKGTLAIEFPDIQDNADTPWRQSLRLDIVFRAEKAAEQQSIGYINLTLVHTTAFGGRGGKPWIWGLLRSALAADDRLKPVGDALRLLWDTSGRLRKDAKQFSDALVSRTIAYVCTISLEKAWRNKGLGPAAMQVLHRMLPTHLGHANVTMLLQPSMLEGYSTPEKAGDVQRALLRFYGQSGYQKIYEDMPDVLPNYTLMCRKL